MHPSFKRSPQINFPGKKHVFTLFELLDEAAPSFNLIDEENDDEELEILQTF